MTSPLPAPSDDYSQWSWEQALVNVLGAAQPINRQRFLGGNAPWITHLNTHLIEQVANKAKPWNDPLPTGQPGKNHFTIYHKSSTDDGNGDWHYQFVIIEGIASWYENANFVDNGQSYTPHDMYVNEFFGHTRDGLTNAPNILSSRSVNNVFDTMENFSQWLSSVNDRLQTMMSQVDTADSGFKGTTSEFFLYKVRNFQRDIQTMHTDIANNYPTGTDNWLAQLKASSAAIDTFLTNINAAWQTFQQQPDPSRMINNVMAQMERQADATDKTLHWGDNGVPDYTGAASLSGTVPVWNFDLDIMHDPPQSPTTYDLVQPASFVALNTAMQTVWGNAANALDVSMHTELQKLAAAFTTAASTMKLDPQHNIPAPKVPPPDPGGNGKGGGNDTNLPNINHGGGGNGGGGGNNLPNLNTNLNGGGGGGTGLDNLPGGGGPHTNLASGGGTGGGAGGGLDTNLAGGGAGLLGLGGLTGGGAAGGGGAKNTKPAGNTGTGGLDSTTDLTGGVGRPGLTNGGGTNGDTGGGLIGGLRSPADSRFPTPFGSSGAGSSGGLDSGFGRGGAGGGDNQTFTGGINIGPLGSNPNTGGVGLAGATGAGGFTGGGGLASAGGLGGTGASSGLSGLTGDGTALSAAGTTASGTDTAGLGGYPFMPPMGGMGGMGASGNQQEKDRERTTWLAEDEEIWGTDPDVAPAVVGREEIPDMEPGDPSRRPAPTQGPGSPQAPVRKTSGTSRPRRP
jgi:hypothetical protein